MSNLEKSTGSVSLIHPINSLRLQMDPFGNFLLLRKRAWPGYIRLVNGKYKVFPSISFTDKKLDKFVCRAIKSAVEVGLEALQAKTQKEKKKRQKESKMESDILKAIQKAFYEGERVLIRTEEMEVGLVPPEDMHVLEEIDKPVEEKNLHMVS